MTNPMVQSADIKLIKQELEILAERLNEERLDRKAEVDKLALQIESLRKYLEKIHPQFNEDYQSIYQDLLLTYDPETQFQRKKAS